MTGAEFVIVTERTGTCVVVPAAGHLAGRGSPHSPVSLRDRDLGPVPNRGHVSWMMGASHHGRVHGRERRLRRHPWWMGVAGHLRWLRGRGALGDIGVVAGDMWIQGNLGGHREEAVLRLAGCKGEHKALAGDRKERHWAQLMQDPLPELTVVVARRQYSFHYLHCGHVAAAVRVEAGVPAGEESARSDMNLEQPS